jgi:ABC-2 type transport system permease protein
VARGELNAGYVVSGPPAARTVTWVVGVDPRGMAMQGSMQNAVQTVSANQQVVAALATQTGLTHDRAAAIIARLPAAASVTVRSTIVGDKEDDPTSIRAVLAGGELTLFIFLTSMFGAQALLSSRQLGVTRRTRAAPVANPSIIAGEAISRYIVAMLQAGIIIIGTIVLFGVDWHSPAAVLLLSAAMALVGTGAAMLLGTFGRSEQQVAAVALLVGLVMAALGGSMQPLEFFPSGMRHMAFAVTPHAWMNDGLWKILVDGAGVRDVLPAVGVLTGVGVVLLAIASRALARRLA